MCIDNIVNNFFLSLVFRALVAFDVSCANFPYFPYDSIHFTLIAIILAFSHSLSPDPFNQMSLILIIAVVVVLSYVFFLISSCCYLLVCYN